MVVLERKAHKPEDVIRPVTMEETISSADSPAHLQADCCLRAEQDRQSSLGRLAASGERGSAPAKRERNIGRLCLLHLGKADTMNLQYGWRRN